MTARIAAGLIPLMTSLYEKGVLEIDGHRKKIHCSEKFFLESFQEYDVKTYLGDIILLEATTDGVLFYAFGTHAARP